MLVLCFLIVSLDSAFPSPLTQYVFIFFLCIFITALPFPLLTLPCGPHLVQLAAELFSFYPG